MESILSGSALSRVCRVLRFYIQTDRIYSPASAGEAIVKNCYYSLRGVGLNEQHTVKSCISGNMT